MAVVDVEVSIGYERYAQQTLTSESTSERPRVDDYLVQQLRSPSIQFPPA